MKGCNVFSSSSDCNKKEICKNTAIPIIILKNVNDTNYIKTLDLDFNNHVIVMRDTVEDDYNKVCCSYEITEPLESNEWDLEPTSLGFSSCIFASLSTNKTNCDDYFKGYNKLIDIVKYRNTYEESKYNLSKISMYTNAGYAGYSDRDIISINIDFYQPTTITKEILKGNALITENARNSSRDEIILKDIRQTNDKELIDKNIVDFNNYRSKNNLPLLEYRYDVFCGLSYLIDLNYKDLIKSKAYYEKGSKNIIDLSFFDSITPEVDYDIAYYMYDFSKSDIVIIFNENQLNCVKRRKPKYYKAVAILKSDKPRYVFSKKLYIKYKGLDNYYKNRDYIDSIDNSKVLLTLDGKSAFVGYNEVSLKYCEKV